MLSSDVRYSHLVTASHDMRCVSNWDGASALLFLANTQQVFLVHEIVSRLWPGLRKGLWLNDIVRTFESAGVDGKATIDYLFEVGAVGSVSVDDRPADLSSTLSVRIGNCCVLLGFGTEQAREILEPALAHLAVADVPLDVCVAVVEADEGYAVSVDGGASEVFAADKVAPGLKIILTEIAFEYADLLILHAATLFRGDRAVLIFGKPGAGKTTLSLFAAGKGPFRLAGDDIAELLPDGEVRGLPFSAAVKTGSVDLLSGVLPSLKEMPAFIRPDKKTVRYAPPSSADRDGRRVGWIIALDRQKNVPTAKLEPMSFVEALRLSLDGAWSEDRKVSPDAFDALAECVGGAERYRLVYSDLSDAVALLDEMSRPASDPAGA